MSASERLARYREIAHNKRSIPGEHGLRPHTVTILQHSWDGGQTGQGTRTTTETVVQHAGGYPPKVRQLRDDEIAVGALPAGAVEIGPITPGLALALASVNGSLMTVGDTLQVRIVGPMHPDGAVYRVLGVSADRALRYMLRVAPAGTA